MNKPKLFRNLSANGMNVIGVQTCIVRAFGMRCTFFLFSIFLALPAFAQSGLRTSDTVLTQSQMADLLSDQVIEFFDGSKSSYGADGVYGYTYTDDGPVWSGRFEVFDDSLVCVDFDNGSRRCDRIIKDGDRVVLITEDGTRFPVRNFTVYQR